MTVHDDELIETASAVARAIGLTTVANVQLKRDADGRPALLEVNPRFPGAMPLTIAAGVDMPSLTLDAVLGRPVPDHVDFQEIANVRYLEDVFLPIADVLPAADDGGPGPSTDGDHHVHSTFSDDAVSTPAENLAAAQRAGLRELRMVDHVRVSTTYVPEFLAAVRALPTVDGLTVLTGVEAKILDASGAVDAPPEVLAALGTPRGPDRVLLADHQVPGPGRSVEPAVHPASGSRRDSTRPTCVEMLVTATIRAMHAVGRAQLAHPFSVLPKIGLTRGRRPGPAARRAGRRRGRDGHAGRGQREVALPRPARRRPAARGRRAARRVHRRAPGRPTSGVYDWVRAMSEVPVSDVLVAVLVAFVGIGAIPVLAGLYQYLLVPVHAFRNHLRDAAPYLPRVVVIVPAWNEGAVLAASLDRLMSLEYPPDRLKVFVVDDASTDDTPDVVRAKAAQYDDRIVHLRREQGGQGKAHTLNHGIRVRPGRRLDAGAAHHGRRRHLPPGLAAPDDPAPRRREGRGRHRRSSARAAAGRAASRGSSATST